MDDIIFNDEVWSNIKILSDRGILKPIAELIEKLNLNEEDMVILTKLINKNMDNKGK
jgi:hypothetical protein